MSPNAKHFDNIVIGAGISGLSCAGRLLQNRARAGSVLVLEARDRIGGRINAVYVNGNRLDTGANWIHGVGTDERPNPLMKILPHKRYRQLSSSVSFQPPNNHDVLENDPNAMPKSTSDWHVVLKTAAQQPRDTDQDRIIPSESAGKLQEAMWGTIESVHELAAETSSIEAKNTTVLNALKNSRAYQDAFKDIPTAYHRTLGGMLQFMEPMEAAPLVAQSAEHDLDIPGMSLLEYAIADFEGDQVFLQDGYIAIVNEVAKDLVDAGVISTNSEVAEIDWNNKPISVTTTSGDIYTADNVVCTLPLGVLKHLQQHHQHTNIQSTTLFNPPLPQTKAQAISALGFGTLDKIFMVYSLAWWNNDPYRSIFQRGLSKRPFVQQDAKVDKDEQPDFITGFTTELPGIQIHQDGTVTTGPRLLSLTNLHSLSGFPVLCAFVSCANATYVEQLADADAAGIVHRALGDWLGREPPQVEHVHVTRWATDPYSYGSYSHMITGLSETKHREEFQQPVVNAQGAKLRFAGEHTSRNHFATVHGALLSGWREADDILRLDRHDFSPAACRTSCSP